MEFSEYVSRLHSIIGAGNSTHAFTRTIFDALTTDNEEVEDILDSYSEDTYKAYFNGNTKITKIANKLVAYIEPYEFNAYLEEFSDFAAESLCGAFSDVLPDATPYSIVDDLSKLLVSIVLAASSQKRKTVPKVSIESEEQKSDDEVIFENLKKPLEMFASALEAQKHQMAEQIRANKKIGSSEDEPKKNEAEVVDDEMPSGADFDAKTVIVQNQTNIGTQTVNNFDIKDSDVTFNL